jgi:hypothetical protein
MRSADESGGELDGLPRNNALSACPPRGGWWLKRLIEHAKQSPHTHSMMTPCDSPPPSQQCAKPLEHVPAITCRGSQDHKTCVPSHILSPPPHHTPQPALASVPTVPNEPQRKPRTPACVSSPDTRRGVRATHRRGTCRGPDGDPPEKPCSDSFSSQTFDHRKFLTLGLSPRSTRPRPALWRRRRRDSSPKRAPSALGPRIRRGWGQGPGPAAIRP